MDFKNISIDEAKKLMEKDNLQILDIRDGLSFENGHIKGAISINNETIENFLDNGDQAAPVLVYCYHGISSQGAAEYLCENDFEEVYSLEGGFTAWQQSEES